MTKEQILKELDNAFNKFKFFEADHHYECNGKRVGISVTKFIEQYGQEFNADEIAEKVADREWKTKEEVLEEWKYKNQFACEKGSTIHSYVQSLWEGAELSPLNFTTWSDNEQMVEVITKLSGIAKSFYEDYKSDLTHIADEYVIGSEEYDIASAVDHLFIDNKTNALLLIDYKTNTYITGWNKEAYLKPMKSPLEHLNDDKFNHYKLQLSIYRYIIEKYTNLKIAGMTIVYMSEKNETYEIIDIPYLKEDVENILEWRKFE